MVSWYPSRGQISIYAMRIAMDKAFYSWREKSIATEYHNFFEPLRPPLLPPILPLSTSFSTDRSIIDRSAIGLNAISQVIALASSPFPGRQYCIAVTWPHCHGCVFCDLVEFS